MAPTTPATSSSSCASSAPRVPFCARAEVWRSSSVCCPFPTLRREPGSPIRASIKGAEFVRLVFCGRSGTFPNPLSACLLPLRRLSYIWLLLDFSLLSLLLYASLPEGPGFELRLESLPELDVGIACPNYNSQSGSLYAVQRLRQRRVSRFSIPICRTTNGPIPSSSTAPDLNSFIRLLLNLTARKEQIAAKKRKLTRLPAYQFTKRRSQKWRLTQW